MCIRDRLVGFIENFQNAVSGQLASMGTSDFLNSLLTDGIIGGVGAVVGFVPLVMVLMFMLSLIHIYTNITINVINFFIVIILSYFDKLIYQ